MCCSAALGVLEYLVPFKVDGTTRTVGMRNATNALKWLSS